MLVPHKREHAAVAVCVCVCVRACVCACAQTGAALVLDLDVLLVRFESLKLIQLAFRPPVRDDVQLPHQAILLQLSNKTVANSARGSLHSNTAPSALPRAQHHCIA